MRQGRGGMVRRVAGGLALLVLLGLGVWWFLGPVGDEGVVEVVEETGSVSELGGVGGPEEVVEVDADRGGEAEVGVEEARVVETDEELAVEAVARAAVFGLAGARRLELPSGGQHKHVLQAWRGRIDPPVTTWEALGALEAEGAALDFALPDGSQAPLLFKRVERFGAGKGVFVAKVEDRPFAEAYFSYVDGAVSGVVRFPDAGVSWEIRNAGDGEQVFEQVDLSALGECKVCKERE